MSGAYETVIGLEVHCELATATKLFCGCPNMFGETSDLGHRCMCALLKLTGKIPGRIEEAQPPVEA